jgi:hypothetical protein
MRRMFSGNEASAALAGLLVLMAACGAAAQEFAGREKLRAHSAEFRREVSSGTLTCPRRRICCAISPHAEAHHGRA